MMMETEKSCKRAAKHFTFYAPSFVPPSNLNMTVGLEAVVDVQTCCRPSKNLSCVLNCGYISHIVELKIMRIKSTQLLEIQDKAES